MNKLADVFFSMAIAIGLLMMTVCMLLLPDYQPPDWVGYTVIAAMAVFVTAGCVVGFTNIGSASDD